ncbi:MAG: putative metal-binding motif-containing protein [Planctomycetota bacterium]
MFRVVFKGSVAIFALVFTSQTWAGGHTWYVNEIFSNASGTIQFIEAKEFLGGAGETGTAGHTITSNTRSFTIPSNVASPTSFKHLLFATPGFVGLPGAPTPDYVFPAGSVPFFATTGDTIRYTPNCTFVFGAGVLPTNGVNSLTVNTHHAHAFTIGPNSPTNYAGQTGSINVGCADVDGDGWGNPGSAACPMGATTDCNDGNSVINPGATEICNDTLDNDCDILIDCLDSPCSLGGICGLVDVPAVSTPALCLIVAAITACGGVVFRKKRSTAQQTG